MLTIFDYVIDRIPSIVAAITAVVALVATIRNGWQLKTIKVEIDGHMAELLELTKKSSHAEGVLQEKNDQAGR